MANESLDEKIESWWSALSGAAKKKLKAEFRIPGYDEWFEATKAKKDPKIKLLNAVDFNKKSGVEHTTLALMVTNEEVRSLKYLGLNRPIGKRLFPESEYLRLKGMPDRKKSLPDGMVSSKYGLSKDIIDALVDNGILKKNTSENYSIKGPGLYRLVKFLSEKKYENLGDIPVDEWKRYRFNGKRLDTSFAEDKSKPDGTLITLFLGTENIKYFCVIYEINNEAGAVVYRPLSDDKSMQEGFIQIAKEYSKKDDKAKSIHFSEKNSGRIGIIYSVNTDNLVDFMAHYGVKFSLTNGYRTRTRLSREADFVFCDAIEQLLVSPQSQTMVIPLPNIGPFRELYEYAMHKK